MLKLISATKKSAKLRSGELMQYIPVPELPYEKLKKDFALASHLVSIESLDLRGAGDPRQMPSRGRRSSCRGVFV